MPDFSRVSVEFTYGQVVCWIIAVPIVYAFSSYLGEIVMGLSFGLGEFAGSTVVGVQRHFLSPEVSPMIVYGQKGGFANFLLVIALGILGLVFFLALFIGLLIVLVPLMLIGSIGGILAASVWPVSLVLDAILVWFIGLLLYAYVLPVLWRIAEPIIAITLGELAYQRARARFLGTKPHYAQPFYLTLAAVAVLGVGLRLAATGAVMAGSVVDGVLDTEVRARYLYTPTPHQGQRSDVKPKVGSGEASCSH